MKWIKIKEQLPSKNQEVICADYTGAFGGLKFNGVNFEWLEVFRSYYPLDATT